MRLGLLPRLTVRHTSKQERGQIYVPAVNWFLFGGVIAAARGVPLLGRLATAYGLAVTGTFLITTTLFLIFAQSRVALGPRPTGLLGVPLAVLELTCFGANLTKILHGGWLPLLIALIVVTVMLTWQRGRTLVTDRRTDMEGPLEPFIDWLHGDPVASVPGTAVFLHPNKQSTPLALRENATFNHVIHEHVLIVSTTSENVPHIPDDERIERRPPRRPVRRDHPPDPAVRLPGGAGRASRARPRPRAGNRRGRPRHRLLLPFTHQHPARPRPEMSRWRKRLFLALAHNAASPTEYFRLPADRTVAMGATVVL